MERQRRGHPEAAESRSAPADPPLPDRSGTSRRAAPRGVIFRSTQARLPSVAIAAAALLLVVAVAVLVTRSTRSPNGQHEGITEPLGRKRTTRVDFEMSRESSAQFIGRRARVGHVAQEAS